MFENSMNDLIKYNNLLYEQGMNSQEAAALLDAHAGDTDFARRARFVRFAYEARKRREAHNAVYRKTMVLMLLVVLTLICVLIVSV